MGSNEESDLKSECSGFADTKDVNASANLSIDLNADLGEGLGGDEEMLSLITSANIAGGGHAGGGEILKKTIKFAKDNKIAIGAHPSYPDRENFGRASMRGGDYDFKSVKESIKKQIIDVAIEAFLVEETLSHVKAHGALYNDAMVYQDSSQLFLESLFEAEEDLYARGILTKERAGLIPVFGLPDSVLMMNCSEINRPFYAEAFADRAYTSEGLLVPRSKSGSVLEDNEDVVRQALQIVTTNTVTSIDKVLVKLNVKTLCVHGDTPGAIKMAKAIRENLCLKGVSVKKLGSL